MPDPSVRKAHHAHSVASLAPSSSRPWLLFVYALFILASIAFVFFYGTPREAEETSKANPRLSVFTPPPQLDQQDALVWHTYVNLADKYMQPSFYSNIVADSSTLSDSRPSSDSTTPSPVSGAAVDGNWLEQLRTAAFQAAPWNSTSSTTAPTCASWAGDWLKQKLSSAPSPYSSPALAQRTLSNLMVADFPPALRRVAPFLTGPVDLTPILTTAASCSMGNQNIVAMLCELYANPDAFAVTSASGSPWSGQSLVEILTFMAIIDRLSTSARDDHVFAADLLTHVSDRFQDGGGTDRFYSDQLPYKQAGLADFLRDKFEAVQLAEITKQMARVGVGRMNSVASGAPSPFGTFPWSSSTPTLSKAHLVQLNLLEAAHEQVQSLPANAQTALSLAWNLQRRQVLIEMVLHEAGNHDQRFALTKDWVDTYISWNGNFALTKFQFLPAVSVLFIPSIICVNDEKISVPGFTSNSAESVGVSSESWISTRGYSLYLLLVYTSSPHAADMYLTNDGNLTNLADAWSTQTLLHSHFQVPTYANLQEMCNWFPSIVSPIVHLSPLGRRMLVTFALFGSVAIAAFCLEYFASYHLLRWTAGGRKQHGAAHTGWQLAEGVFPLALCISVYSRAWWAPLLLVVGLWKLGFPEITAALVNSIPHPAKRPPTNTNHECECKPSIARAVKEEDEAVSFKSVPVMPSAAVGVSRPAGQLTNFHPPLICVVQCAMHFLDGWGTLLHHLSVNWYVCGTVTGLIDSTEWPYFAMTIPLVFMHWATLLQYQSRFLFGVVELGLEIWFELEIFTNVRFCLYYHEQRCIYGMLFAHWCMWAAGLTSYFIEIYYTWKFAKAQHGDAKNSPTSPLGSASVGQHPSPDSLIAIGQSTTKVPTFEGASSSPSMGAWAASPTLSQIQQLDSTFSLQMSPRAAVSAAAVDAVLPYQPAQESAITIKTFQDDRITTSAPDSAVPSPSPSPTAASGIAASAVSSLELSSLIANSSPRGSNCACARSGAHPINVKEDEDAKPGKVWYFRQAARRLHARSPYANACDDDEDPQAARRATESDSLHVD